MNETKGELQSSTIRSAWVSIIGGAILIAKAMGWEIPGHWSDAVITGATALTMLGVGYFARRGRLKATMTVKSMFVEKEK